MGRATWVALGLFSTMLAGCATMPTYQSRDRAETLMRMAGQEAEQIAKPKERLARLLNLADLQIGQGDLFGARATLGKAGAAVRACSADDIDTHTHVSAWVSVSELSRRAGDAEGSRSACQEAMKFLRTVEPPASRIPYLRGLAAEVLASDGKSASSRVLREGAQWAKDIQDVLHRREVLTVLAHDLFLADDYDGGRDVLRLDADVDWRTGVLIQLAKEASPTGYSDLMVASKVASVGMMALPKAPSAAAAFDKDVSYRGNFAGPANK